MNTKENIMTEIEQAAIMAADQAIKKYTMQEMKKKKDYRFRNTKLLLKNYNSLKAHLQNAKDDINEINDIINDENIEISKRDELYIKSIRQSKFRTLIMLAHIDTAMTQLKDKMKSKDQYDKYRAVEEVYIHNKTYERTAEELNCGNATVRRWEKEATNELSILLFGVDGMKIDL